MNPCVTTPRMQLVESNDEYGRILDLHDCVFLEEVAASCRQTLTEQADLACAYHLTDVIGYRGVHLQSKL